MLQHDNHIRLQDHTTAVYLAIKDRYEALGLSLSSLPKDHKADAQDALIEKDLRTLTSLYVWLGLGMPNNLGTFPVMSVESIAGELKPLHKEILRGGILHGGDLVHRISEKLSFVPCWQKDRNLKQPAYLPEFLDPWRHYERSPIVTPDDSLHLDVFDGRLGTGTLAAKHQPTSNSLIGDQTLPSTIRQTYGDFYHRHIFIEKRLHDKLLERVVDQKTTVETAITAILEDFKSTGIKRSNKEYRRLFAPRMADRGKDWKSVWDQVTTQQPSLSTPGRPPKRTES